jgi:hypothetical protein
MNDPVGHFFILALPRSRSAWLANFLTYGPSFCYHEGLIGCRSMAVLRAKLALPGTALCGNADTGAALVVDDLVAAFPKARYVLLCRPPKGYIEQAKRLGSTEEQAEVLLEEFAHSCEVLGERALKVQSGALDQARTMREIWEYVGIAAPFPSLRFDMLRDLRVEAIVERVVKKVRKHQDELEQLLSAGNA